MTATTADSTAPGSRDDPDLAERDRLLADARAAEADGRLLDAVAGFTAAVRIKRSAKIERRLVRMRHDAFELLPTEPGLASWPPQVPDRFPDVDGVPEVHASELDGELLASAITHHGVILVRGVIPPKQAKAFSRTVDRALGAYDERLSGVPVEETTPWCALFRPNAKHAEYDIPGERHWLRDQGSMYTADSPRALFDLLDFFSSAGLPDTLAGYLGERPALSVKKCSLRRVPPDTGTSWHQDGAFLGTSIRTCNVWVTLTACGGDATTPALDVVPRRMPAVLPTGTPDATFSWSVGDDVAAEAIGDAPIVRPVCEPGDAMLFDELLLHRTGIGPGLDTPRHTIETWFFAPSHYPVDQIPIMF
jgi:hypothetical protein